MTATRPLFAILEGGGAKGIAHIGALKAMEARGFSLAGVAGASAGALVAALAAVGYPADDIFQTVSRESNLLAQQGHTTTGLLGRWRWAGFALLAWLKLGACLCALAAVLAGGGAWWSGAAVGTAAVAALLAGLALPVIYACLFALPAWRRLGWFDTAALRECLNEALRRQLVAIHAAHDPGGPGFDSARVLFRHIDPEQFPGIVCPLKIIATDIDAQQMRVFDSATTPDIEIAEAVCASIAIPFAFRPVSIVLPGDILPSRLADGGLVSNLPAWAFIYEKRAWERTNPAQGRVPVVAFRLDDPPARRTRRRAGTAFGYVRSVMRSAVFGGQNLIQNFVDDLHVITLRPALRVFDFNAKWASYCQGYRAGFDDAIRGLRVRLELTPDFIVARLKETAERAALRIDAIRQDGGGILPLRCCLMLPFENQSLRVAYAWNMDNDADDRMVLDRRAPGGPDAFFRKDVVGWRKGGTAGGALHDFLTKYDRALLPTTLKSTICIPILPDSAEWREGFPPARRQTPLGVVLLDSSEDLVHYMVDTELMTLLVDQSILFGPILLKSAFLKGASHERF